MADTEGDVRDRIGTCIGRLWGLAPVEMSTPFAEIGADSIDVVEIVCWMEESDHSFDVNSIPFDEVSTFDDLLYLFIQRGGDPIALASNMEATIESR